MRHQIGDDVLAVRPSRKVANIGGLKATLSSAPNGRVQRKRYARRGHCAAFCSAMIQVVPRKWAGEVRVRT